MSLTNQSLLADSYSRHQPSYFHDHIVLDEWYVSVCLLFPCLLFEFHNFNIKNEPPPRPTPPSPHQKNYYNKITTCILWMTSKNIPIIYLEFFSSQSLNWYVLLVFIHNHISLGLVYDNVEFWTAIGIAVLVANAAAGFGKYYIRVPVVFNFSTK